MNSAKYNMPSKVVAGLLGMFLGVFGLHHLYLKNGSTGAVWFICSLLFSWTLIVPLALACVGFVQGISYFFWSDEQWQARFGVESK